MFKFAYLGNKERYCHMNEWDKRYAEGYTGWDIGYVSDPLKAYFDQLVDRSIKILIPGGGNGYELEYLYQLGFKNVFVCDIARYPLDNIRDRLPDLPEEHLLHQDFFTLDDQYDLIIEQTFFCALDPKRRHDYAAKMSDLLLPNGKLVGVLFDIHFDKPGPPYGGDKDEYLNYFSPYFNIDIMDTCHNSIKPRSGNELFVKLTLRD